MVPELDALGIPQRVGGLQPAGRRFVLSHLEPGGAVGCGHGADEVGWDIGIVRRIREGRVQSEHVGDRRQVPLRAVLDHRCTAERVGHAGDPVEVTGIREGQCRRAPERVEDLLEPHVTVFQRTAARQHILELEGVSLAVDDGTQVDPARDADVVRLGVDLFGAVGEVAYIAVVPGLLEVAVPTLVVAHVVAGLRTGGGVAVEQDRAAAALEQEDVGTGEVRVVVHVAEPVVAPARAEVGIGEGRGLVGFPAVVGEAKIDRRSDRRSVAQRDVLDVEADDRGVEVVVGESPAGCAALLGAAVGPSWQLGKPRGGRSRLGVAGVAAAPDPPRLALGDPSPPSAGGGHVRGRYQHVAAAFLVQNLSANPQVARSRGRVLHDVVAALAAGDGGEVPGLPMHHGRHRYGRSRLPVDHS